MRFSFGMHQWRIETDIDVLLQPIDRNSIIPMFREAQTSLSA